MLHLSMLLGIVVSILSFGAKCDTTVVNTRAINAAIASCARQGGGVVIVPRGTFVTGTIHMRSHVILRLDSGAVLMGSRHLSDYVPLQYDGDLSRYESGRGTVNYNAATDPQWSLSLIQFVHVTHAGIVGSGTIDGRHVFNALGEEHRRGPHTILIADGSHLRFEDFAVMRSANYAFLGYQVHQSRFRRLHISEGWDGIHLRGARRVAISDCEIHTGDDAIAGGYWRNLSIRRCTLNSSCNGLRMIMPSDGLLVSHCRFYGPGRYPHITSGNRQSLAAICLEPGAWGEAPGPLDHIRIRHCTTDSVLTPLSVTLGDDNALGTLTVSHLTALRTTRMALSVKGWGTAGRTRCVRLSHCDLQFVGIDDPQLPAWFRGRSTSEWPVFPSWGLYFRHVDRLQLRHTRLTYTGREYRPAILTDDAPLPTSSLLHFNEHADATLSPFVEWK